MVNPFRYPKSRHSRTEAPPAYTRYQKFKPHLQREFSASCVYCRSIDHIQGYDNFGVDHYRPQGNPLFANLSTEYLNLYYACNRCNRLKREFWPNAQELRDGRFIPNPCDHVMFEHLRYQRGSVVAHSPAGEHTIERLLLNDDDAVEYREGLITLLARTANDLFQAKQMQAEAEAHMNRAVLPEEITEAGELVALAKKVVDANEQLLEQSIGRLALAAARAA